MDLHGEDLMARYFNKVTKNEHVEAFHGPWQDNPDVVDLPLSNTFWGEPMEAHENLTFDVDGLPNGRETVIPDDYIIYTLLQAAQLSGAGLRRALLADSRGDPAPLVAFNAALDAVVAANPYTEAQFLEVL